MEQPQSQFFAGDLIKCSRINHNITQSDLAKKLGWSQSYVSKVESGKLIPDAFEWMALSELFNFPADALRWGFIDNQSDVINTSTTKEKGFSLPKQYRNNRAANLRFLNPFLIATDTDLRLFLKERKVDPSFYSNLDHKINIRLIDEVLSRIGSKKDTLDKCTKSFSSKAAHGSLWDNYQTTPLRNLKKYVKNIKKYQLYWNFSLIETKTDSYNLKITPNKDLLSSDTLEHNASINRFFDKYWLKSLSSFKDEGNKNNFQIRPEASYYSGDDSWRYSITTN